jgi:putative ABC transport system permease protein
VTVVGVFEAGGSSFESEVWADLDTAPQHLRPPGRWCRRAGAPRVAAKFDAFKADVESDKKLGLAVEREDRFYEKASQGMADLPGLGTSPSPIVFSFGHDRRRHHDVRQSPTAAQRSARSARSASRARSILSPFLLESMMLAIVGGLIGAIGSCSWGWSCSR